MVNGNIWLFICQWKIWCWNWKWSTLEKYQLSSAWKSNLDIAIKNGSFGSVIKHTTYILKQRKNASNCC